MTTRSRRDPYGGQDPRELPAYTPTIAVHCVKLSEKTLRAWAFGRSFRVSSGVTSTPPLIRAADPQRHLLSFANLLELHVLRGIRRDHDVQMRRIRQALDTLARSFPSPHPLVDREMETDGVDIFTEQYGSLINLSQHGQLAMKAVFEAHLRRIERDAAGSPIRFFPFTRPLSAAAIAGVAPIEQPKFITIDPRIAFGRPVIAGTRIPTAEVAERFNAGDLIMDIAADYECPASQIEEAIRWERAA